jgi:hypothetical protein
MVCLRNAGSLPAATIDPQFGRLKHLLAWGTFNANATDN